MNELNEKLAELCGITRIRHRGSYCDYVWQRADGSDPLGGHFDGDNDWVQAPWNPIADLNQLKMCYEAAEKECSTRTMLFEFAFTNALQTEFRKANKKYTHYETATAWVKHPVLVAQAILKAKGVG